jgi:hypothetical protein
MCLFQSTLTPPRNRRGRLRRSRNGGDATKTILVSITDFRVAKTIGQLEEGYVMLSPQKAVPCEYASVDDSE